jgi:glycosyltransferase involved in cell wall biosynthesis
VLKKSIISTREIKTMKRKKILCLFDYVARTGFSTVSTNIVKELKKHYGKNLYLDIIAINYFGEPYQEDENTFVISARKNDVNDDAFGRYFFLKVLKEAPDYDGIFICQDLGVIVPFIEVLEHIKQEKKDANQKVFKSIFYFPVDCKIIFELVRGLEFFDLLVTYTEFARKEVKRLRPELNVKVVPHGNNSKDFYPLPQEEIDIFRKEYFGENANKFIVTNINRNQPRKDFPNTIFGFIEAKNDWRDNDDAREMPEPFLYLHTHPNDPMGWDLRAIMLQTDLVEDVDYQLLEQKYETEMCPTEMVNKIYNASDLILTTTLGEGWGLTFSEAAACKKPIIAPYTTSFIEMSNYGQNAYMLKNIYPYVHTNDNVVREQTDIVEVGNLIRQVAKIKCIYANPDTSQSEYFSVKKHNDMIENNYKWVQKLEWKDICKTWIEYFKIY